MPNLHFNKAPIVEAVVGVDLEEVLGEDLLSALRELGAQIHDLYPTSEDLRMGQFEWRPGSDARQVDVHLGFFFKSEDGRQIVHARRNGFAFSRLAPYENWDLFMAEAEQIWTLYRQTIGPVKLSKWTIRFINKLSWPAGEQMEDYLRVYPLIPNDLPKLIVGCLMRLQFPIPSPQGLLTQQLVGLPQEVEGKTSFILDNEFAFPAIGLSDPALWKKINSAREIKNTFFVNSITDKMKELIS